MHTLGTKYNNLKYAPTWVRRRGKPLSLDQYYTKLEVAEHCCSSLCDITDELGIDIGEYTIIEPSAGMGVFYHLFPEPKIGMDIDPQCEDIIEQDFMTWDIPKRGEKKYIAIGNPPFGHRGWMALAFMNRLSLFCDVIGFILPPSFATPSNVRNGNYHRVSGMTPIHTEELPPNSFFNSEGDDISIDTVWQVWVGGKHKRKVSAPIYECDEYVSFYYLCDAGTRYSGEKYKDRCDIFIDSTYYGESTCAKLKLEQLFCHQGHGIKVLKEKERVMSVLFDADWNKYSVSSANGSRHITVHHIKKLLHDNGLSRSPYNLFKEE